MKKILSSLLIMTFVFSTSIFPTSAATYHENNAGIITRAEEIEREYDIIITYPLNPDGYATITMYNLETLDLAFSSVTPAVVRQVSKYYQQLNGKKITVNFIISRSSYRYNNDILMAIFDRATSGIDVYIPSQPGEANISGENPIALVHEFGHAFHVMCMDKYGKDNLRNDWVKFNNGEQYSGTPEFFNPDDTIFVSDYATTNYEEDFAETFSNVFARNVAGTGFKQRLTKDSGITGLGKKVRYIENLLPLFLTDTEQAVENYRKIYDTPATMTFEGRKYSGEYLQFIGYPQPRNILQGILKDMRITAQKCTWVRELGAWRVTDQNGRTFFLFPGGAWREIKSSQTAA